MDGDRMEIQHCCVHDAEIVFPQKQGEKRHVVPWYLNPRYRRCQSDVITHKRHLKPLAGGSSFEFGEFMSDDEAVARLRPRPGSKQKTRELLGNDIFEGPFPFMENCGGLGSDMTGRCPQKSGSVNKLKEMSGNDIFEGPFPLEGTCGGLGSDITGRCPPRPASSSKASELQGHDVFEAFKMPYFTPEAPDERFCHEIHRPVSCSKMNELHGHDVFEAFSNPLQYPAPPPLLPYEPEELRLPPDKIHRNPGKLASHFRLGPPACIDPKPPKTTSAWAKQKLLYGSMVKDIDSYPKPVVSIRKARELAGHTNLFGTPPATPPATPVQERSCDIVFEGTPGNWAESARQVHKTKMQALDGHNAVFLKYNDPCPKQEVEPEQQQPGVSCAKAQELRGNDIFAAPPSNTAATVCKQKCYDYDYNYDPYFRG